MKKLFIGYNLFLPKCLKHSFIPCHKALLLKTKFKLFKLADGKMEISFKGFSPEFFSNKYWKQEPKESYEKLLKERCLQLVIHILILE